MLRAFLVAIATSALATSVHGQYSTAGLPAAKIPGLTTTSAPGGGFLMGADDCATPHTSAGAGPVTGVPFTTGTTGTTGQNEAICLFFGVTGITNDVWFDWTADGTSGTAAITLCGGVTIDTKVAIWPFGGTSSCPAAGTSISCNDDVCGLQSVASWSNLANTTYTIQLGTFPGAAGGSGTFNISQSQSSCGTKDLGVSTDAAGLTQGGETGWIKVIQCSLPHHDQIRTAYGSLVHPGTMPNGNASQIVVYTSPMGATDPNDPSWVVQTKILAVTVNTDTDILNAFPYQRRTTPPNSTVMILASAEHAMGEFPAPMDETTDNNDAWIVGDFVGLDTTDLTNNVFPPRRANATGLPTSWLLRIEATTPGGDPGTPICFGDGTGTNCPCLNNGGPGAGCANGTGGGGVLSASGTASVSADSMSLTADGVINNNGLFFQGNNTIGGGTGSTFGDGIRCCGGGVVRLQVVNPPGSTSPATAQMTETATTNGPGGTITAGAKKCYQFWYRDPATSPCGAQFNLTNAVTVTWTP